MVITKNKACRYNCIIMSVSYVEGQVTLPPLSLLSPEVLFENVDVLGKAIL